MRHDNASAERVGGKFTPIRTSPDRLRTTISQEKEADDRMVLERAKERWIREDVEQFVRDVFVEFDRKRAGLPTIQRGSTSD